MTDLIWSIFKCTKLIIFFATFDPRGLLQAIQDWRHAIQNRQSKDTHCFFKYKFSRLIKGPNVTNNSQSLTYVRCGGVRHRGHCVALPSVVLRSSLIQVHSVWSQSSQGIYPVALSLLHFVQSLWIFSIPLTSRSSMVWSGWQKWAATSLSIFLVLMSEQCPFILMCRAFSVSPTYCSPHFSHFIN